MFFPANKTTSTLISKLLRAEAIAVGVLEVDGDRIGDCLEVFEDMMQDKINEARRVFRLTDPDLYRIKLDQLLRA